MDHLVQESRVSFFSARFPPVVVVELFDSMVLASLFGRDLFRLRSTFFIRFIVKYCEIMVFCRLLSCNVFHPVFSSQVNQSFLYQTLLFNIQRIEYAYAIPPAQSHPPLQLKVEAQTSSLTILASYRCIPYYLLFAACLVDQQLVHHFTLPHIPTSGTTTTIQLSGYIILQPLHTPRTAHEDWGCQNESPSQAGRDKSRYFAPFENIK